VDRLDDCRDIVAQVFRGSSDSLDLYCLMIRTFDNRLVLSM
jgi:hypothetical protein